MSLRIRAKEATPQLTVNGKRYGGSLRAITDVTINIDAETPGTNLVGEKRRRNDLDIDGVSGNFTIHLTDKEWWQGLWQQFVTAERNGDPFPVVTLALTFAYRGNPRHTLVVHDELIIKPDSINMSGKDYVNTAWSLTAREIDGV